MSYFPKPEKNENDLAIILREDTATRSVQAGQYVSWRGRTGKAKADIQQGDALSAELFDYEEDGALNTVDSAIKELNNKLHKWNYIGRYTMSQNFTIPEGYETILVCMAVYENGIYVIRTSSVYPLDVWEHSELAVEMNTYVTARLYYRIVKRSYRTYGMSMSNNVSAVVIYAQ